MAWVAGLGATTRLAPPAGLWKATKEDVAPNVCPTPSGHPKVSQTFPAAPQSVFLTLRGRDVLLYPDRATFYNPILTSVPRLFNRTSKSTESGYMTLLDAM